jgi:glycosyltransferase involved in cell wall biosynthesis
MNSSVSVVVPIFNEDESIDILVDKISSVLENIDTDYEIILVDDGSTDRTWNKIERQKQKVPEIKGIRFKRNYGQTSAMVAGFDYAQKDIIITLDADLQNDPADIPNLLEKIHEGYDIVSGWRKYRKDHFSRVLPSKVANFIISITTGVPLHDYGCSLKAYRTPCVKALNAYGEMHRFFPALASMTGALVTEIPVNHYARKFGKSKYGFERIFKVFSDIFAMNLIIRFSSNPLKGFGLFAIPFGGLSFVFMILAILSMVFHWTAGKALFFFIATALLGMAFFQLIALGIIGELVVNTSDLKHTQLPELTQKTLEVSENGES